MNPILIAAPSSGSGKTTVTLALMAALRRRGLVVAPFKVGPDFIDPGHHAAVCGRISRNLDGWMCGGKTVRESFARGAENSDLAVIEGVMGLFDGADGESDAGSSAEIARWLGAQVVLVVDARSQARSAAALVQGFVNFDPGLSFAGVIFNRVGSARHEQLLRQAMASVPGLPPVLGCLPRDAELALPERHLGLVTAADAGRDADFFGRLADWFESGVEVEQLLPHPQPLSRGERGAEDGIPSANINNEVDWENHAPSLSLRERVAEGRVRGAFERVRIAVARDAAFCFCYPENLERLEAAGAELAYFSPLIDRHLPEHISGLYLPGGYPELHAEQLAANRTLLAEIRERAVAGLPVYAECGGFMLLAATIDGRKMAGVFPARARMLPRRKALGYREVTFLVDTPLGPAGTVSRGHEFHYSEMALPTEIPRSYRLSRRGGEDLGREGFQIRNVLGSYVHLHFGSNPQLAANFVEFCRQNKRV